MQVEDHARAGVAGGPQGARAEQRVHVVHVHDGGPELPHGLRHLVLALAAAKQRLGRAGGADLRGVAHQHGVLDARPLESF